MMSRLPTSRSICFATLATRRGCAYRGARKGCSHATSEQADVQIGTQAARKGVARCGCVATMPKVQHQGMKPNIGLQQPWQGAAGERKECKAAEGGGGSGSGGSSLPSPCKPPGWPPGGCDLHFTSQGSSSVTHAEQRLDAECRKGAALTLGPPESHLHALWRNGSRVYHAGAAVTPPKSGAVEEGTAVGAAALDGVFSLPENGIIKSCKRM